MPGCWRPAPTPGAVRQAAAIECAACLLSRAPVAAALRAVEPAWEEEAAAAAAAPATARVALEQLSCACCADSERQLRLKELKETLPGAAAADSHAEAMKHVAYAWDGMAAAGAHVAAEVPYALSSSARPHTCWPVA